MWEEKIMVKNEILRDYIDIVYNMEKSVYEQTRIIQNIRAEKRRLVAGEEPKKPKVQYWKWLGDVGSGIASGFGFGFFAVLIAAIFGDDNIVANIMAVIGIICWIAAIISLVSGILSDFNSGSDAEEQYKKDVEAYKQHVEDMDKKRKYLGVVLIELEKKYSDSKYILNQIYSVNIIYPKYRNIVAVSSFYDYLMSGRCYTLEASESTGNGGAYNIFENEIRMDVIIGQLDMCIQRLEEIKAGQYMLYQAISESNHIADRMSNEIIKTKQSMVAMNRNVELLKYETNLTRKEIEYQNKMKRLLNQW